MSDKEYTVPISDETFDKITQAIGSVLKCTQDALIASQPCEHIYGYAYIYDSNVLIDDIDIHKVCLRDNNKYYQFTYCPRCGIKLLATGGIIKVDPNDIVEI